MIFVFFPILLKTFMDTFYRTNVTMVYKTQTHTRSWKHHQISQNVSKNVLEKQGMNEWHVCRNSTYANKLPVCWWATNDDHKPYGITACPTGVEMCNSETRMTAEVQSTSFFCLVNYSITYAHTLGIKVTICITEMNDVVLRIMTKDQYIRDLRVGQWAPTQNTLATT